MMKQTLAKRFYNFNFRLIFNKQQKKFSTKSANLSQTNSSPLAKANNESTNSALSKIQDMYIKKLNEKNMDRYLQEKKVRLHHRVTGSLLFLFVFGVYFYTMFAIKQEKFLDDFDVPEPPDPAVKTFKGKQ